MVLPIIFHSTFKGIKETDPLLLEMATVFRVPAWKRVLYIYVKSVAPYVVSAAITGVGFAWKSGIAAEMIAQVRNPATVGYHIHRARTLLLTEDLFAWTIAIVGLSFLMEKGFLFIVRRVGRGSPWRSR